MKRGLTSITFRRLPVAEVVRLAKDAGLQGMEWGGDIHVPHGNMQAAENARLMTREAGLEVASYGSYYCAGENEGDTKLPFAAVLDTAVELGAPTIRVWPGNRGSSEAGGVYRVRVVEDVRRIAEMAQEAGIGIACEYHGGTLTDTSESAVALVREVAHANLRLYWQPAQNESHEQRIEGLKAVLPHLANVHAFHWIRGADGIERCQLAAGEAAWRPYLQIATIGGLERWVLLEYVRNDSTEQLLEDAAALKKWLGSG